MNITLKSNCGHELIFEADNVKVTVDVESRTYIKDENDKVRFDIPPIRDISTDALEQFANVLSDLIHYRKAEFDSSTLIESLFEKLPSDTAICLVKKMVRDYDVEI